MRPNLRPLAVLVFISTATLPAAVPSYETTWQFAISLQGDYAKERGKAFMARLDSGLMFRRVAAILGEDVLRDPRAQASWDTSYRPVIERDFNSLATYEELFAERVALVDGDRVLQCILRNANGNFTTLALWLDQRPDGSVAIMDYRTMSQSLEATRRIRALIVYLGGAMSRELDPEEMDLAMERDSRHGLQQALLALGEGRPEASLRHLLLLPPRVRRTSLWRDLRDGLALQGCQPAQANALAEARDGQPLNPVIALGLATTTNDVAATIAAFRALAERSLHSPYIRALHAGALLQAGRAREALDAAENLYLLNPFSASACAVAVRAAARLEEQPRALAALGVWARLTQPELIDRDLAAEPDLAALRAAPAYRTWLERAPTATAGTAR